MRHTGCGTFVELSSCTWDERFRLWKDLKSSSDDTWSRYERGEKNRWASFGGLRDLYLNALFGVLRRFFFGELRIISGGLRGETNRRAPCLDVFGMIG